MSPIVPFLDLGAAYRELQNEIEAAILRSLRSGWYIGGYDLSDFEQAFSAFTGSQHCIGVSNGLAALFLALRAVDVSLGDEVIVPSNTFIATWLAVSNCGAIPVPVEPQWYNYTLDPDLIEAAITSRTKAIIPVHLYGQPADLGPILKIADKYGLRVIEDAAQAHGAAYRGQRIGHHGDAVTWSFYPGKNLGALGDGGAVTTDNADIAEKIRILRNYGSKHKYRHEVQGYNERLDPVQAAALKVKLKVLDEWNRRRTRVARLYAAELADTDLILPVVPEWADPVWHLYVVKSSKRDELQQRLNEEGIECLIHYPIPPHLQAAYATGGYQPGDFPLAEKIANQVISLPISPQMDDTQVDRVITAVRKAAKL